MFQELSIRNFAIIDDLHISFSAGLTVFSGETGAGKSIIINAVNLLLGSKASPNLIRSGCETAELEALFRITSQDNITELLEEYHFEPSDGLLVRRVIARNNRHKIYINGHLATLQMLHAVTENLASISGQHAHQGLIKEGQHLLLLDQFADLMPLREDVCQCFHEMAPLIQKLKQFKGTRDRQAERVELLQFQQNEILQSAFQVGEDVALERERLRLKNAEALGQAVESCIESIYTCPGAVIERLGEVRKTLERAALMDPDLSAHVENISSVVYQVEDISEALRTYRAHIQVDERRLEEVETRLNILHKLKRKYDGSLEAVKLYLEKITLELSQIENIGETVTQTAATVARLQKKLVELSSRLSIQRKEAATMFAQKMEKELSALKMPHTKFQILVQDIAADYHTAPELVSEGRAIQETGYDGANFLIAPNVGEALKPLADIASGGELSRVILALKAIQVKTDAVGTVIFDEVDAGIGGGVAEIVGKKLHSLARHHQVICITHLPQIAKFGDHHLKISKQVSGGRTQTVLRLLTPEERVREIARMLGGETITPATLAHASEMLQPGQERK
ncbi:MAG: DNA repair protein RecN [Desulfobacterales bacterium]|nr:DNA repair protein RecN [Desulfobacterales bacterium]